MIRWISTLTLMAALPALAQAHGPVPKQASFAVNKVAEQFLKEESKENIGKFAGISAKVAGDEIFEVQVTLKGGSKLDYRCGLDTEMKPPKWGCRKNVSQ